MIMISKTTLFKVALQRTLRFVLPKHSFSSTTIRLTSSTVFALSSGHGRCGVAVIRVSGPSCSEAVKRLCGQQWLPRPRQAVLRRLYDPGSREIIDQGLVLWFPGPSSFTGEDCAEFQVHGGTAVVAAMLDALGKLPGLCPAEPGDFTKRALLNGKMDLTEVEGLGDLIHAETAAQRRQALRQMEGDLGNLYDDWRRRILKCLANVEAFIDFSEDENIEEDTLDRATAEIEKVCEEVQRHLSDDRRGERLRDGVHVTIIGEPNVGKSSLLNALCQRPAAIVSPMAGTTRDVVETAINLAGYPVLLSDTAGLRETRDVVEEEGVRRALDRALKADLKILVLDASTFLPAKPSHVPWANFVFSHMAELGVGKAEMSDFSAAELEMFEPGPLSGPGSARTASRPSFKVDADDFVHSDQYTSVFQRPVNVLSSEPHDCDIGNVTVAPNTRTSGIDTSETAHDTKLFVSADESHTRAEKTDGFTELNSEDLNEPKVRVSKDVIVALNKSDLASAENRSLVPTSKDLGVDVCCLSCATTEGLDSFVSLLAEKVKHLCGDPLAGSPSLTQSRHRTHLAHCLQNLNGYLAQTEHGDIVLAAQALRRAMRELGRVTGAVNVEDVLDVIFKDFCIGK